MSGWATSSAPARKKSLNRVFAGEALGAGDGGGGALPDPGVAFGVFGDGGLFEEEEAIGFDQPGDPQGGGRVEEGVGVVHDFDIVTDRFSEGVVAGLDVPELFAGNFGAMGFEDGDARFDGIEAFA